MRVYDWPPGKGPTHTFMGHLGPVAGLRFTPDGKAVASGAQDTSVLLWDLSKAGTRARQGGERLVGDPDTAIKDAEAVSEFLVRTFS